LRAAGTELRARAHELAVVNETETGRPCAEAQDGVLTGAGTLKQYAELGPVHRGRSLLGDWSAADLMVPEPRGVVVALTPWNDPVAVACGLIGAALVTGNVVVHKPSERAPHTGLLLGEILRSHLPADVLTTLVGDGQVGAALVGSELVDVVAHVGSCATGRSIAGSVRAAAWCRRRSADPVA
jgi:acyl-CoA reductase-like NAD-dependent aldehyde dehydrogenase